MIGIEAYQKSHFLGWILEISVYETDTPIQVISIAFYYL